MKLTPCLFAGLLVVTLSQITLAEQNTRPDHYHGEPSATTEQAVANFREYNKRLAKILAQETLSAQDMNEVHQLTYTLENALEKLRADFADLAEVLEEVHVASETLDTSTVKAKGKIYLDSAHKVIN